jgi:hypothetical protein
MKGYLLAVAVASSLALTFAAGCGSSSGGNGGGGSAGSGSSSSGGGGVTCSYTVAGTKYGYCATYANLPSADESTIKAACTAEKGTSPSSCPTANQTGCCNDISEGTGSTGYKYSYCVYGYPSSEDAANKTACGTLKGTWKQ